MSSPSAEVPRASVTEVTTSLLCPRLFWFGRVEGRSTLLGRDEGRGIGRLVHDLIHAFEEAAPNPSDLQVLLRTRTGGRRKDLVSQRVLDLLYWDQVAPRLATDVANGRQDGDRWLAVMAALERYASALADVLVRNARALPPDQVVGRTLVGTELPVEAELDLAGGARLRLVGRIDSVWAQHSPERVLLCEWKTRAASLEGDDALQLALYARLLEESHGVAAHGLAVTLDADQAGASLRPPRLLRRTWKKSGLDEHLEAFLGWARWVPGRGPPPPGPESQHLCEVCPQVAECFRRFGDPHATGEVPASLRRPDPPEPPPAPEEVEPPPPPPPPRPAAAPVDEEPLVARPDMPHSLPPPLEAQYLRILDAFDEFGVEVTRPAEDELVEGPSVFLARVAPGRGVTPRKLRARADALKLRLELPSSYQIRSRIDRGAVVFEIPKREEERSFVPAEELWAEARWDPKRLAVPIGRDIAGELVELDFASSDSPHLLIGGMTGQGKSVALRVLLEGLCRHRRPEDLRLFLVDPKRIELRPFEEYDHVDDPAVHTPADAAALLERAVEQMENRYDLFAAAGVLDLAAYNEGAARGDQLPRWLVVLDEYADLVVEKDAKKSIEASLGRLSQKARAAGVHLIVATQRPEAKILSSTVRSNLGAQLALRVRDGTDSKLILGETGAEALIGKGDALLRTARGVTRVQCGVI